MPPGTPGRGSASASVSPTAPSYSRSPTTGPGSRRATGPACSTASSGSAPRVPATPEAPGSAWPSSPTWSGVITAPSGSPAPPPSKPGSRDLAEVSGGVQGRQEVFALAAAGPAGARRECLTRPVALDRYFLSSLHTGPAHLAHTAGGGACLRSHRRTNTGTTYRVWTGHRSTDVGRLVQAEDAWPVAGREPGDMSEPMVTALGHAGLRIDGPGVRVLADPWLSPGGAFLGSWFPFPDNAHLLTPEVLDVDLVVVSHEHLDHLDLDLIASLPETVPVVVPRYPSTIMERRLRAIGRTRIVVLDAWQRYALNDHDWLTVIPEQCPMSPRFRRTVHDLRPQRDAHQRRPDLARPGSPGDDRGRWRAGRDGCADVRRELASGPLRVRRGRAGADLHDQAGRQVQGRHASGPSGRSPGW